MNTSMLNYALDYAARGWSVFPAPPGEKKSYKSAEHSNGIRWGATTNPATIKHDFRKWSDANIGLPCGADSGFFVVEADTKEGHDVDGISSLRALEATHGPLPTTLMGESPSGSLHHYFRRPSGIEIKNSASEIAAGVDVRGDGGMVIAPPSVKPGVGEYKWLNSEAIAEAPAWLIEITRKPPAVVVVEDSPPLAPAGAALSISEQALANVAQSRGAPRNERPYCERALNDQCDALAAERKGGRNIALNTAALKLGQFIGPGRLSESEVRPQLFAAATANGLVTDKGERAVNATIDSGISAGMKNPRVIPSLAEISKDDIKRLNKIHAVLPIGGKTRVVTFGEMEEFPGRETITMTQTIGDFRALQNKYRHKWTDKKGEPQSRPMGDHWIENTDRRQYDGGMAFMPQHDGDIGNRLNLWRGFGVKPIKPDGKSGAAGCNKFLEFMRDVICNGDEATFDYLRKREATIFQKRIRSEVALGLRTEKEGCGKGFYEKTMGHLLGHHAMQVSNPKHIIGAFNPHLETLLRLTADEALFVGSHEHRNALFGLITEPKLTIEPKGCGVYTADSFLNLSITSNAAHFLPVSGTARRFLIPTVSTSHMQDFKYFNAIQSQLDDGGYQALLHHFLHEVDLTGFNVRLVPQTEALLEQRNHSLAPLEAWWCELLETGTLMGADPFAPHRAVSNSYQRQIEVEASYGTTQIRYVNQPGLYDQAKQIEPRLRNHASDHRLGIHLNEMGCDNTKKVLRRRGWTFPELSVCRATWEKKYPGWQWRDNEITEWRAEEADDAAAEHFGPPRKVTNEPAEPVF